MKIILGIIFIVFAIVLIGNEVVYQKQVDIIHATRDYNLQCVNDDRCLDFIYPRKWTFLDCLLIWRWNHKAYLTADEYEKLKPYLK